MNDEYFSLRPPSTPWGLPHGLDRGGVLNAPWVSHRYIDADRPVVPTNSVPTDVVPTNVFAQPVAFTRSDTVRAITAPAGPMGQFQRVGPPPIPIQMGPGPEPGAIGRRRGGIFTGARPFPGLPAVDVPTVPTLDYRFAGFGGLVGYGAGPDGLG